MVGPVQLDPLKVAAHRGHVELIGGVPRSQVLDWLTRFDIFFFPTTCEGSAGSVMEAMASGLPVVTTPNSGTVARDGIEGFVAPYHDLDRLANAIRQLTDEPDLRLRMGKAARKRIETFNMDWYAQALADLYRRLFP
jgi:glycosyltransferase involved in cell wall biosynthesis